MRGAGRVLPGLWVAGVLLGSAGLSAAATTEGVLITNMAAATFSSPTGGVTYSPTYGASAYVLVAAPCLALRKLGSVGGGVYTEGPFTQASGGAVTFQLWVVNCSPTSSAFNVTVWDDLPPNVAYVGGSNVSWNGGGGGFWTPTVPPGGQTATYKLTFVLDVLGPTRSAFQQYQVTVQ